MSKGINTQGTASLFYFLWSVIIPVQFSVLYYYPENESIRILTQSLIYILCPTSTTHHAFFCQELVCPPLRSSSTSQQHLSMSLHNLLQRGLPLQQLSCIFCVLNNKTFWAVKSWLGQCFSQQRHNCCCFIIYRDTYQAMITTNQSEWLWLTLGLWRITTGTNSEFHAYLFSLFIP